MAAMWYFTQNEVVSRIRKLSRRCCIAILALLSILSPGIWAERLPMRLYTTEDGLWSDILNYMMRDSRGFIWFCTRDGLSRFDGYRFINYRIGDDRSSQNFTYMYESRDGIFWIALGDGRFYRYDPRTPIAATPPAQTNQPNNDSRVSLPAELVSSNFLLTGMIQDRNGHLWAVGPGLFLVEETAGHVSRSEVDLHLPQRWKPSFVASKLAEGSDGSLWLTTTHGLLRRLPNGQVVQYHVNKNPGPEDVRLLLADKDGYIWSGPLGEPYVLKPEPLSELAGLGAFRSRRLITHPPSLEKLLPTIAGDAIDLTVLDVFAGEVKETGYIYQQSNRQIWLVARDRLVLFDGRDFRSFTDNRATFSGLIEDLDGNLWVATSLGGVARLSVRGLVSYDRVDGLGDQYIASLYEDHDGRLNAVGGRRLISRLGERKFLAVRANIPEAGALWTSTLGFLDHSGQWWFLTRRGLYRFPRVGRLEDLAGTRPLLYTNLDGLPGQWVYCMFEDSRGDLWISIRNYDQDIYGLVRWRRSNQTFRRLTEADGLPAMKSAASFAEDRAGNLWFGFYQGGLARYAAGRFTSFTAADGAPEGFITALHVDRMGRLWITSATGGLARLDDPTAEHLHFVHYTTQEGLSSNNARTLTDDLAGNIYIGTVRGLDRLTPETGKVTHYGLADGLAGDFLTTAYRDRNGALWFGTPSGLSRLDPQPDLALAAPPIRIEGLRIAGVKQRLSELGAPAIAGLELSAAQSNLQIDYSSLSMARAALLRYQYQLQGVDSDWSAPTEQRTVHYANLSPGRYRFLVRAVDPAGLSSPVPASVDFRIFPPLWQRWWFLAMVATAIGFVVALLYRYRVGHLLELERVRIHIATDLHDDIGSSLSQIAVLSEVVRRQVDGNEVVSQPLSTIASTSRELVDSMSDIVWAINPNRDNLSDLSHRMRRFASDLFTTNNIEFRFNARETERHVKLDADVRRQVFLIFKEAAHNIVRHSRCSNVEVDLHIENHAIALTLKDDGKGFDTAQASQGHGLSSMTQRAETLGAKLEISSRPGDTTVLLKVPMARRLTLP
jgi:signal transduction histidine kinase/ligand-binding sensor domain-containing protein